MDDHRKPSHRRQEKLLPRLGLATAPLRVRSLAAHGTVAGPTTIGLCGLGLGLGLLGSFRHLGQNNAPIYRGRIGVKMTKLSVKKGEKLSVKRGGGLTAKGRKKYNRENGSHLKAPAPHPRTKKEAARRKSFCARSRKWNGPRGKAARRRWNC